jgi:hypothetical protein
MSFFTNLENTTWKGYCLDYQPAVKAQQFSQMMTILYLHVPSVHRMHRILHVHLQLHWHLSSAIHKMELNNILKNVNNFKPKQM